MASPITSSGKVGAESEAYLVDGGVHEGNFWSDAVLDTIFSYLERELR